MKHWIVLLVPFILCACVSAPPIPKTTEFFHDYLFSKTTDPIRIEDVFSVSQEMKDYLRSDIAPQLKSKGHQQGLYDALYNKHQLKLEYDSVMTKNAAQTFHTKTGNCLSLAIMTAAFAKNLGLGVEFQSVVVDETWSRSGNLYINSGHVNIVLGKRDLYFSVSSTGEQSFIIDFQPQGEIDRQHTHLLSEKTILAMYLNNRAVELLMQGSLDEAYWAARQAITQDVNFISSYNTLAVIYKKHNNPQEAQQVLSFALQFDSENTVVISNLIQILEEVGQRDEARILATKLEKLQPYPPFYFFKLGQEAMLRQDYIGAKKLFSKEVARDAYYHEFHFWLAQAYFQLGELKNAGDQLTLAQENSASESERNLYNAKLNKLKMLQARQ